MSTASLIALSAQATRCAPCICSASSPSRSRSSSGSPKRLKPSLPSIPIDVRGRARSSRVAQIACGAWRSRRPRSRSTALVTGASSGIGEAIARELARRGHGVTLVARREERLRELAGELRERHGVRAEVIAADLGDAAARDALAGRDRASSASRSRSWSTTPASAAAATFADADRERLVRMVRLNCEALLDLQARYLPAMVERGRGAVINIASTAAFQPIPGTATYAATKAFVLSLTEAVHEELKGTGVTVTAVCPGPVKTEFMEAAGIEQRRGAAPGLLLDDGRGGRQGRGRGRREGQAGGRPGPARTAPARSPASTRRARWCCRSPSGSGARRSRAGSSLGLVTADQLAAAAGQSGDQLERDRDEGHERRREHGDDASIAKPARPRGAAGPQAAGADLASEVRVEGEGVDERLPHPGLARPQRGAQLLDLEAGGRGEQPQRLGSRVEAPLGLDRRPGLPPIVAWTLAPVRDPQLEPRRRRRSRASRAARRSTSVGRRSTPRRACSARSARRTPRRSGPAVVASSRPEQPRRRAAQPHSGQVSVIRLRSRRRSPAERGEEIAPGRTPARGPGRPCGRSPARRSASAALDGRPGGEAVRRRRR